MARFDHHFAFLVLGLLVDCQFAGQVEHLSADVLEDSGHEHGSSLADSGSIPVVLLSELGESTDRELDAGSFLSTLVGSLSPTSLFDSSFVV